MRKIFKTVLILICSTFMCLNCTTIGAKEIQSNEIPTSESSQVEVYDGFGNLVYVCDTLEEAEFYINNNEHEQTSSINAVNPASVGSFFKLCKFFGKYLNAAGMVVTGIATIYMTVQYAKGEAEFIDIVDQIVPVSTMINLFNTKRSGYIYGTNASNPYPPHSQQGATWLQMNTYYIIE